MKIRKIIFNYFRSFRGVKEISFLDPLTDEPRPMTVIVGSNGTGKTTILDAVEGVLSSLIPKRKPIVSDVVSDIMRGGCVCVFLQLSSNDLKGTGSEERELSYVGGRIEDILSLPEPFKPDWASKFDKTAIAAGRFISNDDATFSLLHATIGDMLYGGLIYFPHTRDIMPRPGGPIQPPPDERTWVFRFKPQDQWEGSLEQLWLWQNYLDLEEGKTNRENLTPFVSMVEDVLGEGRKITIHKGRVWVPPQWAVAEGSDEKVRIDQLPSGERQVLLLFGELARRLRRGAVVMIDEPEISLHPTMQRLVVAKLRRLAREWDLQVILATHSMEIVHAVSPTEVINLDYLPPVENQVMAQTEGVAAG